MDLNDHALALGRMVGNLQSLEMSLRAFLENHESTTSPNYFRLRVGDQVPVSAFSNYDSLAQLMRKFNSILGSKYSKLLLDLKVADLRDALAHGRVSADRPGLPLRLLKFDKPRNGQVLVTFSETMDETWLQDQRELVLGELKKVVAAGQILQPSRW